MTMCKLIFIGIIVAGGWLAIDRRVDFLFLIILGVFIFIGEVNVT